jgi:hypothetical protein
MVSSINELHEQFGPQLAVVGVDANESLEAVRAFVDEHELGYLNLVADLETLRAYGVRSHPLTLLLGPGRQVFSGYLGYTEKATLERDILSLLQQG